MMQGKKCSLKWGEMIQVVSCSLNIHKDPRSNFQHSHKKADVVVNSHNSSAGKEESEDTELCQWTTLAKSFYAGFSERLCLKTKMDNG